MSTRLQINGIFRGLTEGAFQKVQFSQGTNGNLAEIDLPRNGIYFALVQDYGLGRDKTDASSSATSGLGFYLAAHDPFDSDSEQQLNLIASLEILTDQFFNDLELVGEDYGFQISNIRAVPIYKRTGDTLSGLFVTLDMVINRCAPNQYPNLKEFTGEISRRISPYNWQGVDQNGNAIYNR